MQKINFEDYPSTNTPIDADNLNDLQDNVEEAIEELKEVILYEDETGATDNITLEDDISNYKYFEVSAYRGDKELLPTQRYYNNESDCNIHLNTSYNVLGGTYPSGAQYSISGTNLTLNNFYKILLVPGSYPSNASSTSDIYINKIVGYK